MKSLLSEYGTTAGFALTIPIAAAVWLVTVPEHMSLATFATATILVIGAGAVALNTWRNGQATESTGQLLHETDTSGSQTPTRKH